ncbi:hypothetical protein DSL72_004264 [Monilinia vaccinii-corymbosi]|uniref:Uncharacterized protein n=1 Tax=Monilinia vaccinii-corymbosi TaxID=61207 RepID=A0A8A3P9P7_9HELO|nr:hypothetical protein DSL72_004264 [Monilinia vaccinii-corymbosi]
MSMILVKFNRLPIPPLTVDSSNANDYQPWYEAIQLKYNPEAPKLWKDLSRNIVFSMRNHHRDYQWWNYKICKMEVMWMLGKRQAAPQVLYEFSRNDAYLEVHDGQHERIATALALQDRNQGDYMHVTYQAGPSSNGLQGNVFMEA